MATSHHMATSFPTDWADSVWYHGKKSIEANDLGPKAKMKGDAADKGHTAQLQAERRLPPKAPSAKAPSAKAPSNRPGPVKTSYNLFGSYPGWEEALAAGAKLLPEERHWFEMIRAGRPCKPYFDIDGEEFPPGLDSIPAVVAAVEARVREALRDMHGVEVEDRAFVWLQSPQTQMAGTKSKAVSLHLTISTHAPQLLFRDNEDCKPLAAAVAAHFPTKFVDLAVYSADRVMRMFGASKALNPGSALAAFDPPGRAARGEADARRESLIGGLLDGGDHLDGTEEGAGRRYLGPGGGDATGGGGRRARPPAAKAKKEGGKDKDKGKAVAPAGRPVQAEAAGAKAPRTRDGAGTSEAPAGAEDEEAVEEADEEDTEDRDAAAAAASAFAPLAASEVRAVVACLPKETADDREAWVHVALALKDEGAKEHGDKDAFFEDWAAFSAKAAAPRYYKGKEDCHAAWNTLHPNGDINVGKLCQIAKTAAPEAYAQARTPRFIEEMLAVAPHAAPEASMVPRLAARFPEHFGGGKLRPETTEFRETPHGLSFFDSNSGVGGLVRQMLMGVSNSEGTFLGQMVANDMLFKGPFQGPHGAIGANEVFVYRLVNEDLVRFTSASSGTVVQWHKPSEKNSSMVASKPGWAEDITLRDQGFIADVHKQVLAESKRQCMAMLPGAVNLLFNNNGTINIFNGARNAAGTSRRDDETIAGLVIRANPETMQRIRIVLITKGPNKMYYCDPATNIWSLTGVTFMERVMIACAGEAATTENAEDRLTDAEHKHYRGVRGRKDLMTVVTSKKDLEQKGFECRLDSRRDLFVLENCVVEALTKTIRPIRLEDYVSETTGWSYDPEEARKHMPDVQRFFEEILPLREERDMTLAFIASSLTGMRTSKKFLVLTDKRSGNNGKSTLIELLQQFFTRVYNASSTDFICMPTHQRDRDAHAAGVNGMCGKRLLISEELKSYMKLDIALLKKVTGGTGVLFQGRKFGSEEQFSFYWTANVILVFNEGDCPGLDGDKALLDRMLVAPMRSKFVPGGGGHDGGGKDSGDEGEEGDKGENGEEGGSDGSDESEKESHTFTIDKGITSKFREWNSALLELLIQHHSPGEKVLDAPPASTDAWKRDVALCGNRLTPWMKKRVEVTGKKDDYVLLPAVISLYEADRALSSRVMPQEFEKLAVDYLSGVSLAYKKRANVKLSDGSWKSVYSGVAKGVRLMSAFRAEGASPSAGAYGGDEGGEE